LIKRRKFPKVFLGWWTVLATGFIGLWFGGYKVYGMSALFKPMAKELGFSRTVMSIPNSIGTLEGGFEGPLAGWIADKYGPKWIIFFGVFLYGLSLILMSFVNSLWVFYVVWGFLAGTAFNFAQAAPVDKAITDWFVKKRGAALGTKSVIQGLSGVIVLPFVAWLIITQGWRTTFLIGGLIAMVVGLPLVWFFIKPHRPEYYGLLPDGAATEEEAAEASQMIDKGVEYAAGVEEVEFTLRQALRTRAYWLLIASHIAHSMGMGVMGLHLIPYLTDVGIDPLVAAGMMSVMVFSSLPCRFIAGYLMDRLSRNRIRFLIAGGYFIQAVGFAIFLLNQKTMFVMYVWLILYGVGMGVSYIQNAIVGRYYGRKAFGFIHGSSRFFLTIPAMIAPIFAGWVYDTFGSYEIAFLTLIIGIVLSTVIMAFTTPPKPPAEITDIHKTV